MNDKFGIQVRGGCSCAGTYGHYLFGISKQSSKQIMELVDKGDLAAKPGWIRFSIHPTMSNAEAYQFISAIKWIIEHLDECRQEYVYDPKTNDYFYCHDQREDFDWLFHV